MFAGELQRQKRVFTAVDTAAIIGAFATAIAIAGPEAVKTRLVPISTVPASFVLVAAASLWIATFRFWGLHDVTSGGRPSIFGTAGASLAAMAVAILGVELWGANIPKTVFLLGAGLSFVFVVAARNMTHLFVRNLYSVSRVRVPLAVFGFNPSASLLANILLDEMTPYAPVAFLDDRFHGRQHRGIPVLPEKAFDGLVAVCPGLEAAIALEGERHGFEERIIEMCETHRARWWLIPHLPNRVAMEVAAEQVGTLPILSVSQRNLEGLNFLAKRAFDIVAGAIVLVMVAPLIAIAAAAIWLWDGTPVFFRQTRVGMRGERFEIMKLRTMRQKAADTSHREYVKRWIENGGSAASNGGAHPDPVFKLTADGRVTPVGRILRRFSADELPQLINVLRGDMSLIGPRPALPYELDLYRTWHWRRLDTIPGITGLWQVSGRNRIPFDEMVRLDLDYIKDWSLKGDLKILLRTVPVLLQGDGL